MERRRRKMSLATSLYSNVEIHSVELIYLHKSFSNTRQIFCRVASESELRAIYLSKNANKVQYDETSYRLAQYFLKSIFLTEQFLRH